MKEINIPISSNIREDSPKSGKAYDFVAGIKEHGVIERVILQEKTNEKYLIIDGRRRIDGAELAGLIKVPAKVYGEDDLESGSFNVTLLMLQMRRLSNPGREFKALNDMVTHLKAHSEEKKATS